MEEDKAENPAAWTREDWDNIRQKEERILEIISV